jgi:hypothetical protein
MLSAFHASCELCEYSRYNSLLGSRFIKSYCCRDCYFVHFTDICVMAFTELQRKLQSPHPLHMRIRILRFAKLVLTADK